MKRTAALMLVMALVLAIAAPALAQSVPERVYGAPKGPPEARPVCENGIGPGCRPKDVPTDHWAANSIMVLVDLGLVQGREDATFDTDAKMTAGETTTLFLRVLGIRPRQAAEDEHWAAPALQQAKQVGLIDEEVDPEEPMTRLQVARLLAKALGVRPTFGRTAFRDSWGLSLADRALLNGLYQAGVFKGFEDGTFRPTETLTRAQVAILVERILGAQ